VKVRPERGGSTGGRGGDRPTPDGCWPKNRNARTVKSRFYQSQNAPKVVFLSSYIEKIGEGHNPFLRPLLRWGGDTPPHTSPPRRFRRLILAPTALDLGITCTWLKIVSSWLTSAADHCDWLISWRVLQEEHKPVSETGVFPSLKRVSGTLCLLHYVTETSHLYSLRDFRRHLGLSRAARIVTVVFLRRVQIFLRRPQAPPFAI